MPDRPVVRGGTSARVTPTKRSILALSFAISMVVSFAVLAATVTHTGHITVNSGTLYTWATATTGTHDWGVATNWSPNGVPGSAANDTVSFSGNQSMTVQVTTVIPSAVTLNNTTTVGVTVEVAGGTLPIATAVIGTSTSGPGNILKVSSGQLTLTGGTLTLNGAGPNGGKLQFSGGTVSGGTINVSSPVTSGGSIVCDGASGPMSFSGVQINNSGLVNYTTTSGTNTLSLDNGTTLTNSGELDLNNNTINNNVGSGIINNGAAGVTKSLGTGTASIGATFNNGGSVQFASPAGTFEFSGGGLHIGTFQHNVSTGFTFNGAHTFNSGASISSCSGCSTTIQGGTFVNNAGLSIDNVVQNGGTLGGGGTLSISGNYAWHGGTMDGSAGTGKVSLAGSTPTMTIDGSIAAMTLTNGYGIQSNGGAVITYSSPANVLSINNGGHIDLTASPMNLTTNTAISSDFTNSPTINLNTSSTLAKTGGTGTSTVQAQVNGVGALTVNTGSISLAGGGTLNGNVTTISATNAVIVPGPGTVTLASGNVSGPGTLLVNGGTLATNLPLGSILELKSGTVTGSGNLTLNAGMKWEGGTMTGGGHTIIPSGQTLDATLPIAPLILNNRTIDNSGSFNFDPTASAFPLNFNNSTTFNNNVGAIIDIRNGGTLLTDTPATSGIANAGTLKKSAGSGGFRFDVPIGNGATLDSQAGTIILNGGGLQTGLGITKASVAGAFVDYFGGNTQIMGGTLSGPGAIRITGGVLQLNATMTAPVDFRQSAGMLTMSAGGFNVPNGATYQWAGGTINGANTLTVQSGGAMTIDTSTAPDILDTSALSIASGATATWTLGTNSLTLQNGAVLSNAGTFDAQTNSAILASGGTGGTINNSGTFKRTTNTGAVTVAPVFNNTGTVSVLSGGFTFSGNGTDTGTYSVGGTGVGILFSGGTRTIGAAGGVGPAPSPAVIQFTGGTFTDNGTYNIAGNTVISGASVILNTTSTPQTGTLQLSAGSLGGSMGLQLNGASSWSGGSITSGLAMTVAVGANLAIAPNTTNPTLDGRIISDNGTITYNSVSMPLFVNNGGGFTTSASGNFLIQTNVAIQTTAGASTFVNQGTFSKVAGTGTTNLDFSFNNQGNVDLLSGTVDFKGGYTQSTAPAHTFLGGGNLTSSFGALNINAGLLKGSGNIGTSVNNSGTLDPGVGPTTGIINVTGNYTQTAGGTLHIDLGGAAMGQFDQLNVTGTANLAGNLNVANAGAFSAAAGNTFTILQFGSLTGDFTHPYTLPPVTGGTMQAAYAPVATPTSLVLTAVGNADLGVTITGPPTVGAGQNGTFTVNAGNSGPAGAANPALTVTVSAGSFVSATGGGWACSFSANMANCTQAALNNGAMAPLTVVVMAPPSGTIGINATISSPTPDPNTMNNNATFTAGVSPVADLAVVKTGPSVATTGSQITYSIMVTNNGPSAATGVTLTDATPSGTTFVSVVGGGCTAFPCNLGNMATGQSISLSAKYQLGAGTTGSVSNTATVGSSTIPDPVMTNNSSTVSTTVGCPVAPSNLLPAQGVSNVPTAGMLSWNNTGAQGYNVYLGPAGSGCSMLIGNASLAQFPYSGLQAGAYEWRVEAVTQNCPTKSSSCVSFTTSPSCATPPATLIAPASGANVSNPVNFAWSAVSGAMSYDVFASVGGGMATKLGTTSSTSLTAIVPNGTVIWYVVANGVSGCGSLQSPSSSFNACSLAIAPAASVVGEATSNQSYSVAWPAIPGSSTYQVDEANNDAFNGASTQTVMTTSVSYTHATTTTAQAFFYRVRAITDCNQQPGPNSTTVRVVIIPLPGRGQANPSTNVPVGSTRVVVQQVFIPGVGPGLFTYSASTDQVWLSVAPPTGVLPIDGVTLDVTADPAKLPNGTFTATVLVTITQVGATGKIGSNAAAAVSVPVSVNLVTPVSSGPGSSPQSNSLIIPSIGHLDGINSHWQSDIRLNNPTADHQRYQLIFTPAGSDVSSGVKTTTIDVNSGETTALDDIVRNWYGVGSLGDSANGFLEIRPVTPSGKGLDANAVDVTKAVASSRTYNVSNNGTLGQFIPAVPFSSFIAKAAGANAVAPILSLQQIAQSDAFRTNIGLVEASGQPASVLLSVFNSAGIKIQDFPITLKGSEQKQLNSFLAQNNIVLPDGRIQVQVTSGSGKVTAYASVIDNKSGVPLLVSGVPLGTAQNNHYVLPGVADLNTGGASWRTDMRIFNGGTTPQAASLVFYPQNNGGLSPSTESVTINPGEVKALDNILQSTFGQTNIGGAMHILTMSNSSLIVTGRTYNLTPDGTFGQFIPAVTPFDAVGKGDRSLQILQVEDSVRYRTNLGLAEVTGNAVTVEVTVVTPDSKVTPKLTFMMQPNEFRQFGIIRDLGLGNTYNARISVRVIDGDGRLTAYGSVIDMVTQDPTYVPAQ